MPDLTSPNRSVYASLPSATLATQNRVRAFSPLHGFVPPHFFVCEKLLRSFLIANKKTSYTAWFFSVVQMMRYVPQNKLITKGPFSVISHPIYTSVAILVTPEFGFLFDTWIGLTIEAIIYIISRIFRGQEDKKLNCIFTEEYQTYRSKVLIPWL
jgi:protein-S-isoprenylcysteine O-methyltransferase Ste14